MSGPGTEVVSLLKAQHRAIRRQFVKAALPGPGREPAFEALRRLLAVHEGAEEAHVHPVARKVARGGRELVRQRLAEEKQAKKLLRELERTGPRGDGYLRLLGELRSAVLRHAQREETEEFPLLREGVTALRRRALGWEAKVTQALGPTRPHPRVNTELANKLAAPLAGPVDRARDLLSGLSRRS